MYPLWACTTSVLICIVVLQDTEEPLIPLASEDSDLGDTGDFESFSGTDEEEEDMASLSTSTK